MEDIDNNEFYYNKSENTIIKQPKQSIIKETKETKETNEIKETKETKETIFEKTIKGGNIKGDKEKFNKVYKLSDFLKC